MIPAKLFMDNVVLKYEAPSGSEGYEAKQKFISVFPNGLHDQDTAIFFDTTDDSPLFNEERNVAMRNFLSEFNATVCDRGLNHINPSVNFLLISYFDLNDFGASTASKSLLNHPDSPETSTSMIASLGTYNSKIEQGSHQMMQFANWLDSKINELHKKHFSTPNLKPIRIRSTGILPLGRDLQEGVEKDLIKVDGVTFPLALLVFAVVLSSPRLLVIPIICIGVTVVTSFAIMYPISIIADVISTAPSVMMSCAVAFSIDYSLFMLSRFNEEIRKAKGANKLYDSVLLMTDSAGHTIFVSGLTVVFCWLCLIFFPVIFLRSMGLGAGVTIFTTFIVNITLPGALIMSYPNFFVPHIVAQTDSTRAIEESLVGGADNSNIGIEENEDEIDVTPENLRDQIDHHKQNSKWYKFAEFCYGTVPRAAISVFLISVLCFAFFPMAISFHHSESFQVFAPKNSKASQAANKIDKEFGGRLMSYSLLVESSKGVNILSDDFFQKTNDAIENVLLKVDVGKDSDGRIPLLPTGIIAPSYMRGYPYTYSNQNPNDVSFVGCVEKVVATYEGKCLKNHCQSQVIRCLTDLTCDKNLACIARCKSDINCLAGCVDKSRLDGPSVELGKCAMENCLPFNDVEVDMKLIEKEKKLFDQGISKPDCMSVVLLGVQQVEIDEEVDENGKKKISIGQSIFITMELNTDPFGSTGGEWLDQIRKDLKNLSKNDGYKYYLGGGNSAGHDMVLDIYSAFPVVVTVTVILVFIIVGWSFKSVFIPLRSLYSIVLTLSIVYGSAVAVYEHEALNFIGWSALKNPAGNALSWLPTSMLFAVLVGLSLDYDIFLLTRIYECKRAGMNDRDAILCGVARSGRIITAAATIMAIAFAGLLFSSSAAMNQSAFLLVISVLIDSFIIRSILVPALMILAGSAGKENTINWWPAKYEVRDY